MKNKNSAKVNSYRLATLSLAIGAAFAPMGQVQAACTAPTVSVDSGQTCSSTITINSGTSNTVSVDGNVANGINILNSTTAVTSVTIGSTGNVDGGTTLANANEAGIYNEGSVTTLTNAGKLGRGDGPNGQNGLSNYGTITTLNNSGTIDATSWYSGVYNSGTISTVNNSGRMTSQLDVGFYNPGTVGNFNNEIGGIITGGYGGFYNNGSLNTFNNHGTITSESGAAGVPFANFSGATITTLNNSGTISSANSSALANDGTITTLSNSGTIQGATGGSFFGIDNTSGTIGTLNNAQGASTPLTFTGKLPTNYNVFINSTTDYGKLVVTSPTGTMNFGIASGSTVTATTYQGVVSGTGMNSLISNTTGSFGRYTWTLAWDGTEWDLTTVASGPSQPDVALTLASIEANARAVRSAMNLSHVQVGAGLGADCAAFNGPLCFVVNGSAVRSGDSKASNLSLTGGFKLTDNIRVGGFYQDGKSGSEAAGVKTSQGDVMGLFAGWSENADGTGYQVRVNWASGAKDLTTTRSGDGNVEAGSGNSTIKSRGVSLELSKRLQMSGFGGYSLTPYAGLSRTKTTRGAYAEQSEAGVVEFPLSYDAMNLSSTAVFAGLRAAKPVAPKLTLSGSVGAAHDVSSKIDAYSGTSSIGGLERFSVDMRSAHRATRLNAGVGLSYEVSGNARISAGFGVGQSAFGDTVRSVSVGYQINF